MRSYQKIDFSGHLDKDSDPTKVLPGNYTSAKNIQFLTENTESTKTHIPMKGNIAAFSLGITSSQNKVWRLYTSNTGATVQVGGLFIFDMNGNLLPTINAQIQPLYFTRNAQTIVQQAASLQTKLETIFGVGNATATATTTDPTVGAQVGYIDIAITVVLGYDWGAQATTDTAAPTLTDTAMDIEIYQEAFDLGLIGENHAIGSFDLLGDLYVWSTPRTDLPTIITPTITNITINTAPNPDVYRVTTSAAHGLTSGQKIAISGVVATTPGVVSPNGIWIITVINATTFDLKEYYNVTTGFVYSSGGIITIDTEGVGNIGVGQFDANTDAWTYIRIARTKQWNFTTKKQIDTYAEQNSIKASLYWTDDYNVPRCLYYIKEYDDNGVLLPFVTDGVISTINPAGIYTYNTIELETRLQLTSSGARLSFLQQLQAGGQVLSGNWRYAIEFLTESLTTTIPSDLTNPINVYSAPSNGDPSLIIGDAPSTITPKINQLEVTGILPGLFKYVQLIGVNYVGDAVVGYIIKRELLSATQTSIILNHTGTETGTQNYDLGLLNQQFANIATARNIDVIDKRMILSDITTTQAIDFTAWAASLTHTIGRVAITAVRSATDGTIVVGEYQDPENVYNYLGHMHNETYRFGVKLKLKNGGWTQAFWVDDITINCATAVARRTGALTDFNLTDNTSGGADDILWSAYVSFSIGVTELDYIIDGKRFKDIVETISFVRAEVVPTVLACGIIVPSLAGAAVDAVYNYVYDTGVIPFSVFGEFPFISGRASGVPPGGTNPLYDNAEFATSIERTLAAFYSPDVQFEHTSISFLSGDVISIFGNPFYTNFNNYSGSAYNPEYGQYSGRTYADLAHPPLTVVPTSMTAMDYGQDIFVFPSTKTYKKQAAFYNNTDGSYSVHYITQSLVLETAGTFDNPVTSPAQEDRGFYYSQYVRALSDQYGAKNLTQYVSTGSVLEIDASTGASTVIVFGGDTFTQMNFLRHRTFAQEGIQFTGLPAPTTPATQGFGGGVSFYCQNRINAQMKEKSVTQTGNLYPAILTATWLDSITNTDGNNGEAYQEGYTARNEVQSLVAFDPDIEQTNDMPARIMWSDIKAQGSASDSYRNFLPLNFHDLDQTFGAIVHHANGNGELLTWQQRAFMRQYFNTRGTLEVKGVTEILIGDGSVMSRDGVTVSRLGCKHKWAIIKGKSAGGNDTFYWINTEIKKALRFGYDGTVSIADIKDMQSFFANNLTWVNNYDTPADGQGICGFWDDRYANAGWTMRARRSTQYTYSAATDYTTVGQLVFYQPATYSTFEQTGELFLNKVNGNLNHTPIAVYPIPLTITSITGTTTLTITTLTAHLLSTGDSVKMRFVAGLSVDINNTFFTVTVTGATTFTIISVALINYYVASSGRIVEVDPKWWELIEHTNSDYYNEYTVIFNEFKNAFITNATFLPKIYLKWTDTFLSPRPISPEYHIYQHNKGDYLTWYLDNGVSQQEKGHIEGVVNAIPDEVKWYEAVASDSIVVPDSMELSTTDQESFLIDTEFKVRERNFYSPIKQDSTNNGVNDGGTSLLYDEWLKVKMFFKVNTYQALKDLTIKFRLSPRLKSK
jgi:hypothetical protein